MPKRRDTALQQFFERLGFAFKDRALVDLALTHASARPSLKPNEDNERLEFLGDRVLGLAIAELLTASFPDASEGELARRFKDQEVPPDWSIQVVEVLQVCDGVKFANEELEGSNLQAMISTVRQLVEQYPPQPQPAQRRSNRKKKVEVMA